MFGWNQKFQIALVHRCYRPEYGFDSLLHRRLYGFLWKTWYSELTDNASAANPTSRMKALGKDVSSYSSYISKIVTRLYTLAFRPARLVYLELYAPSRVRFYVRRRGILH